MGDGHLFWRFTWIYGIPHGVGGYDKPYTEYPLVNIQKAMENHGKSQFLMGKSTINGHFPLLC